jgi:hypothetical protein
MEISGAALSVRGVESVAMWLQEVVVSLKDVGWEVASEAAGSDSEAVLQKVSERGTGRDR